MEARVGTSSNCRRISDYSFALRCVRLEELLTVGLGTPMHSVCACVFQLACLAWGINLGWRLNRILIDFVACSHSAQKEWQAAFNGFS